MKHTKRILSSKGRKQHHTDNKIKAEQLDKKLSLSRENRLLVLLLKSIGKKATTYHQEAKSEINPAKSEAAAAAEEETLSWTPKLKLNKQRAGDS